MISWARAGRHLCQWRVGGETWPVCVCRIGPSGRIGVSSVSSGPVCSFLFGFVPLSASWLLVPSRALVSFLLIVWFVFVLNFVLFVTSARFRRRNSSICCL